MGLWPTALVHVCIHQCRRKALSTEIERLDDASRPCTGCIHQCRRKALSTDVAWRESIELHRHRTCIHQCRRKALSTRRRFLGQRVAWLLSAFINVAERR